MFMLSARSRLCCVWSDPQNEDKGTQIFAVIEKGFQKFIPNRSFIHEKSCQLRKLCDDNLHLEDAMCSGQRTWRGLIQVQDNRSTLFVFFFFT